MKLPEILNRAEDRFLGIDIYGEHRGKLWHRVLVEWPLALEKARAALVLWVFYRVHPRHRYHIIDTRLSPRYYENVTRLQHGMFAVLCDHVEEHGLQNLVDSVIDMVHDDASGNLENHSPETLRIYKEKIALHKWWTVERPAREKLRKELAEQLYRKPFVMVPDWENPGRFLTKTPLRARIDELRKERDETETAMMHRLVAIHASLWT